MLLAKKANKGLLMLFYANGWSAGTRSIAHVSGFQSRLRSL